MLTQFVSIPLSFSVSWLCCAWHYISSPSGSISSGLLSFGFLLGGCGLFRCCLRSGLCSFLCSSLDLCLLESISCLFSFEVSFCLSTGLAGCVGFCIGACKGFCLRLLGLLCFLLSLSLLVPGTSGLLKGKVVLLFLLMCLHEISSGLFEQIIKLALWLATRQLGLTHRERDR
jgi:hypothetical protein